MEALQRPPRPELAPFVRLLGYYEVDGPPARELALPTGGLQLLVNLDADELGSEGVDGRAVRRTGGAVLQGAQLRPSVIETAQQRAIAVVAFTPGGAFPFFAAPPSATAGQLVDLDALGADGAALRERLLELVTPAERLDALEAALVEGAVRPLQEDGASRLAAAALERGVPVAEVTERLGMTPKRLIRHFSERVGLTPKRFARVRRFQRVLASIPHDRPPDWAEIAARCGYFDQSHLIHDFRAFSGLSPTAYRPRSPGEPNHVPL